MTDQIQFEKSQQNANKDSDLFCESKSESDVCIYMN